MKTAIKAIEDRMEIVQTEIGYRDGSIARQRKQIEDSKQDLSVLYQERDELASAIAKLRSDK